MSSTKSWAVHKFGSCCLKNAAAFTQAASLVAEKEVEEKVVCWVGLVKHTHYHAGFPLVSSSKCFVLVSIVVFGFPQPGVNGTGVLFDRKSHFGLTSGLFALALFLSAGSRPFNLVCRIVLSEINLPFARCQFNFIP